MTLALDFATDGRGWPHREASRFVHSGGLKWHVQEFGSGPLVLLVHGTASATHSWRSLAPLLASTHAVLSLDLPGHGFTERLPVGANSLANMAAAVGGLLRTLGVMPAWAIGHSAGAAILIRMGLDGALVPSTGLVGINAALLPYGGFPGRFFLPVAQALAANPLLARAFTWRAKDVSTVERVIASTGSSIDRVGLDHYAQLFRNPGHVRAALEMMANWNLDGLVSDIARLQQALVLIACGGDQAVLADDAFQVRDRAPGVAVEFVRSLGHLAHEEQPAAIAALLLRIMDGDAVRNRA
jgi:magnesium chelatase accessory protein